MAELVCDVALDATQRWMDEREASKPNTYATQARTYITHTTVGKLDLF